MRGKLPPSASLIRHPARIQRPGCRNAAFSRRARAAPPVDGRGRSADPHVRSTMGTWSAPRTVVRRGGGDAMTLSRWFLLIAAVFPLTAPASKPAASDRLGTLAREVLSADYRGNRP